MSEWSALDAESVRRRTDAPGCPAVDLKKKMPFPVDPHALLAPAGWYTDPWALAPMRWFDGYAWTGWTLPRQRVGGAEVVGFIGDLFSSLP